MLELRERFDIAALQAEIARLMENLEARAGGMANHEYLRDECLIVIGRIQGHMEMLRRLTKVTRENLDELRIASDITNDAIKVMRSMALSRY